MKLCAALLAAVVAVAVTAGASKATMAAVLSLTIDDESSSYAYASGTTLYYSSNAFTFTVKASDGIAPYTFDDVPGFTKTVSGSGDTATYDGTPTASTSGKWKVSDTTSTTVKFTMTLDNAPTVSNAAPTEITGASDQYWSSSSGTLWFRPAGTGSFTLNATASDPQTGIDQVAFPDVSGTSGWSGSTGGFDTSPAYASPVAYTWTAGAAAPGAKQVTATNGTSMTTTATVTISGDSTGPTGQTIVLNGGPWYATTSVPLTIGMGTDAGAGVDPSRGIVERAAATLTNGACGTFGSFAGVTLSGDADTGVATGNCYRYQYKAADKVGNLSAASTASADAKVDATPPTTPSFLFTGLSRSASSGSVVYYRPAGGTAFTVSAASSDGESGIASYSFPTVTGFTAAGFGPRRTYSFSNAAGVPAAPFAVTATNGAGLTSASASFTLVPDGTPPTLAVRCNGKPCLAATYAKPVTITATASDGTGSGVDTIRYTTDGTDPTVAKGVEYGRGFAVRALTRLKMRAFDRAGNPSEAVVLTIRSAADRLVFAAPPCLAVKTGAHYLSAKVTSSHRAIVSATMTGPNLKKPQRWRFILGSGTSIVQLRLPAGLSRGGVYEIVWAVQAGTQKTGKTTRVVFGPPKTKTR